MRIVEFWSISRRLARMIVGPDPLLLGRVPPELGSGQPAANRRDTTSCNEIRLAGGSAGAMGDTYHGSTAPGVRYTGPAIVVRGRHVTVALQTTRYFSDLT